MTEFQLTCKEIIIQVYFSMYEKTKNLNYLKQAQKELEIIINNGYK